MKCGAFLREIWGSFHEDVVFFGSSFFVHRTWGFWRGCVLIEYGAVSRECKALLLDYGARVVEYEAATHCNTLQHTVLTEYGAVVEMSALCILHVNHRPLGSFDRIWGSFDIIRGSFDVIQGCFDVIRDSFEGSCGPLERMWGSLEGRKGSFEGIWCSFDRIRGSFEGLGGPLERMCGSLEGRWGSFEGIWCSFEAISGSLDIL